MHYRRMLRDGALTHLQNRSIRDAPPQHERVRGNFKHFLDHCPSPACDGDAFIIVQILDDLAMPAQNIKISKYQNIKISTILSADEEYTPHWPLISLPCPGAKIH